MFTFRHEFWVSGPVEAVWDFHSSAEALRVLTPPGRQLRALTDDLEVREGAEHVFAFRQFGLPMVWRARIHDVRPPFEFTDTALQSPFAAWSHHHAFVSMDGGTSVRDTVTYRPPGGPFAPLVNRLVVARQLVELFDFRAEGTRRALGVYY